MIRMVYPFLPIFGRGLGVDLSLLSVGLTLRSASGLLSPFLASIADSRGRKAGMLFGVGLFTASVGLMTLWPTYPAFLVTLVVSILGNFVFIPSMQAYLGDSVPYRRRGLVLAMSEFGWSLSFIIGVPLMGLAIGRFGWQAPFPILTGMGILAMITLAGLLPRDRAPIGTRPGMWRNLGAVFNSPMARAGILIAVSMSMANELVNLIFGVWLENTFAVQIAALAAASAVIGVSELGGEALVSAISDWLGKHRSVSIGLVLNLIAVLGLPMLGSTLNGALLGLFFFYLTFEFTIVSSIPLMTEVLPTVRATFMSTYIAGMAIGRGIGALLSLPLYKLGETSLTLPPILVNVLVAAGLNLLAFVALRAISVRPIESAPAQAD
jgi:predicted MFS family arabinose efflux permease